MPKQEVYDNVPLSLSMLSFVSLIAGMKNEIDIQRKNGCARKSTTGH